MLDVMRIFTDCSFILLVTLVQVVFFSWTYTLPHFDPFQNSLAFDPHRRQEVWRLVTYMFVHKGLKHILSNVLFQLLLGIPLEMVHGRLCVGAIYVTGVLAGSLASSVFNPHKRLVGASGGVCALLAAYITYVIRTVISGTYKYDDVLAKLPSFYVPSYIVGTIVLVALMCVLLLKKLSDFGYFNCRRFLNTPKNIGTSTVCHLAGAIAGIATELIILYITSKSLKDRIVFWITPVASCALLVCVFLWKMFYKQHDENTAAIKI